VSSCRPGDLWAPFLGGVVERRSDVCGNLLDAAGLAATILGATGRVARGRPIGQLQLLGEQLLWWCCVGTWWCLGIGGLAEEQAASARARFLADGLGSGNSRQ